MDVPENWKSPNASFCPRYLDVFDKKAYKLKQTVVNFFTSRLSESIIYQQTLYTVADIFKYTPPEEDVFLRCFVRNETTYNYVQREGKACYELFKVDKFYHQEFVCYRFSLINIASFDFKKSAYALNFPGVFYLVELNTKYFNDTNFLKAIVHRTSFPAKTSAFAPVFSRKHSSQSSANLNYFKLSYYSVTQERLEAPYKTQCTDYSKQGHISRRRCANDCVDKRTTEELDRVPFSTITTRPILLKHVSYRDIENRTFSLHYQQIESFCRKRCILVDCKEVYFVTQVSAEPYPHFFRFSVDAPREPSFIVTFLPKIDLNEFLVFVFSCFGTWFGISILSLDPFRHGNRSSRANGLGKNAMARDIEARRFLRESYSTKRLVLQQAKEVMVLKMQVDRLSQTLFRKLDV